MSGKRELGALELDRTIHEKARLMILAFLSSSGEPETGFTELRDALALSAGNLSIQLKNLEEAGYVGTEKGYRDNKPYTGVRLTASGRRALGAYLAELEVIVASLKARPETEEAKGEKPVEV
jgi:DNA-binding MarR family transcriptional regulator